MRVAEMIKVMTVPLVKVEVMMMKGEGITCCQRFRGNTVTLTNKVWLSAPLPSLALPSLKLECDKLASEKSEMQRHYIMVSGAVCMLFCTGDTWLCILIACFVRVYPCHNFPSKLFPFCNFAHCSLLLIWKYRSKTVILLLCLYLWSYCYRYVCEHMYALT